MKLILPLCLISSFFINPLFAAEVVPSPQIKVDCETQNKNQVNWIGGETISDEGAKLRIRFVTFYGSCIKKKIKLKPIDLEKAKVQLYTSDYRRENDSISVKMIRQVSSEVVQVEILADKDLLFIDKDLARLEYSFMAEGKFKNPYFNWYIMVQKTKDSEYQVQLQNLK